MNEISPTHVAPSAPATDSAQQLEIAHEALDHHALLCSLLAPVCDGNTDDLLPIQRKAVRHYLAEIGRLLEYLALPSQQRRVGRIDT